jgi:hypothetical protein
MSVRVAVGRILIGEPDPSLVRFGGLAVAGELARALDLRGCAADQAGYDLAASVFSDGRRGRRELERAA